MKEAPAYNNTEWWSACYDCMEDAAYVQVIDRSLDYRGVNSPLPV